jgi:anti-anti-sigma factor
VIAVYISGAGELDLSFAGASEPNAPLGDRKGAPPLVAPEGSPRASIQALRPAHEPRTIELRIAGRIDRADAARLGRKVRTLLDAGDVAQIVCDLGAVTQSDVAVVDALCRMRLAARRRGCQLMLRDASKGLLELLFLMGLTDIVRVVGSGGEVERESEQREHPGRVEEERDPADPAI